MKKIHLFISLFFISGIVHAQTQMIKLSDWGVNEYSIPLVEFDPLFLCGWANNEGCFSDIWGYVDNQGGEYAILGGIERTLFIDISDPTTPFQVTNCFQCPFPADGGNWHHRDMNTYNDFAYVVKDPDGNGFGLEIYDLSDLPNPNPDVISLTAVWSSPPDFTKNAHNVLLILMLFYHPGYTCAEEILEVKLPLARIKEVF